MDKSNLLVVFTLFLVLTLFGAVYATGTSSSGKNVSTTGLNTTTSPKLIDSGVTLTKSYIVKKDVSGHYSIGVADQGYPGMKYPTKYYWKTYLYPNGTIIIYTHFYHSTLNREINQKIVIGTIKTSSGSMVYHSVSPKSWGASSYWTLDGFFGTPSQYYWNKSGKYPSFRDRMIEYAPSGPG
jgi:hypothetical protein